MGEPKAIRTQIRDLLRNRPEFGAPLSERAAWALQKANVLRAIADEGGYNAEEARVLAVEAESQAAALVREMGGAE